MDFLSSSIKDGSFCEIKLVVGCVTICTGTIVSVNETAIMLRNPTFFMRKSNFDAIITILSRISGLQVFKAKIVSISDNGVVVYNTAARIVSRDRRAGFRAAVSLPALITLSSEPSVGYDAVIRDISISGIAVSVCKTLDVGTLFMIQFPLHDDDTYVCVCNCSVVRTIGSTNYSMCKYGCDFINMPIESQAAIKAFMTQKRTQAMAQMLSCT